jgi:hypothetical protein
MAYLSVADDILAVEPGVYHDYQVGRSRPSEW